VKVGQQIDYPMLCYQTHDGWVAFTPALPAAHGSGPTAQDAREDLEGAIAVVLEQLSDQELTDHLADLADRGPILTTSGSVLTVQTPTSASRAG
jgi:predicted RNase H-like HicB family nuclease